MITFSEYQKKAVKTAVYGAGSKIIYPALGLGNESGEVLGKIKKVLRDNNGEFNAVNIAGIADEISDVLWYLAALTTDLNLDLGEIAEHNLLKVKDRQARNVIHGNGDHR